MFPTIPKFTITQSVAPVAEPVSLAEAKAWLRIDTADEDSLIGDLVTAAIRVCQQQTGKQFINATYVYRTRKFPGVADRLTLPNPPLSSVTSIQYVDTGGTTQTLNSSLYTVVAGTEWQAGYVIPIYSEQWPSLQGQDLDVIVTYVSGFGAAAANVPDAIRTQILMMVAEMYESRGMTTCGAARPALAYGVLSDMNARHEFG